MRTVLFALLVVGACSKSEEGTTPPKGSDVAVVTATGSGSGVVLEPTPGTADPWQKSPAASSDDPPDPAETMKLANEACPTVKAPYLFAVTKGGKTSYLLGTRHLGVGLDKMPPVVGDKISHASLAVFEVDPKDTGGAEAPPPAKHLSEQLGDKAWKHYIELAGRELASDVDDKPPAVAAISLEAMYEDKSHALDIELQNLAASSHVPTGGLETSEFQDKLIDHLIDMRALNAALIVTKSRKDLADESKRDLGSFCLGERSELDPKERADMLAGGYSDKEVDAYQEEILYARNRDWIPKLQKLFEQDNVFVAVGCDHLMGDKGVPALLTKQGYTVTRIKP